jgi:two-component sensor histidine kinase
MQEGVPPAQLGEEVLRIVDYSCSPIVDAGLQGTSWGTQLSLYYRNTDELRDFLVPFVVAGAEQEVCSLLVCARGLNVGVHAALNDVLPDFAEREAAGEIELVEAAGQEIWSDALLVDQIFDREERALARGYGGLRVAIDWTGFSHQTVRQATKLVQAVLGGRRLLAISCQSMSEATPQSILEGLGCVDGTLAQRDGQWRRMGVPVPSAPALATELHELREALAGQRLLAQETVRRLARGERLSRMVLDALPAAVYTTDATGRITFCNKAAQELAGNADGAIALTAMDGAEAVLERTDGRCVPIVHSPVALHDEAGALIGAVNMLVDVSQQKRAERIHRNLVSELNHRVKNALATVQALAAQTIRNEGIAVEVRNAFEGRLVALSRSHGHLSRVGWGQTDLQDVVQDILSPFQKSARIGLEGPPVMLMPQDLLTISLVIHELLSNARRFGALSVPEGMVRISWRTQVRADEAVLVLDWQEDGGPLVQPPEEGGFGCRFIRQSIRHMEGAVALSFDPNGVKCHIETPLLPDNADRWMQLGPVGQAEKRYNH